MLRDIGVSDLNGDNFFNLPRELILQGESNNENIQEWKPVGQTGTLVQPHNVQIGGIFSFIGDMFSDDEDITLQNKLDTLFSLFYRNESLTDLRLYLYDDRYTIISFNGIDIVFPFPTKDYAKITLTLERRDSRFFDDSEGVYLNE